MRFSSALAVSLAGLSFLLTVIWGPPLIRVLKHFRIAERMQILSPANEFYRLGTPTMGGILVILPVLLITLLLNAVAIVGIPVLGNSIWLPLGSLVLFAGLGTVSDWRHLKGIRRGGLKATTKFLVQIGLAAVIAYGLWQVLDVPEMFIPLVPGEIELGLWYLLVAVIVIVSATNAVNLTGGIEGLSGLIMVVAFGSYGAIALYLGQVFLARFCFTVVGALLGFLWFNIKPAQLMMGNTGTYALGATLGVVALMTGYWILLPLIAFIPLVEAVSVMMQVGYFRMTGGRRIFRMAPYHYHLELGDWSETQIVQRFLLINLLFALVGVALAVV